MTTATPTKLRSGDWGAKIHGTVAIGDEITITTRAGKSWQARVSRVVWTDGSVAICATTSPDRPQATRRSGTWTGCSCGSREDSNGQLIESAKNCWTCEHDA